MPGGTGVAQRRGSGTLRRSGMNGLAHHGDDDSKLSAKMIESSIYRTAEAAMAAAVLRSRNRTFLVSVPVIDNVQPVRHPETEPGAGASVNSASTAYGTWTEQSFVQVVPGGLTVAVPEPSPSKRRFNVSVTPPPPNALHSLWLTTPWTTLEK